MLAQGNPVMTKANKVMDVFYLDEQERKRYEAAWEYESDRLSMISESERKGLERGLAEGKTLGLAEGEARGKSLGLAEGSRQKALETAKTMLTMGYPLDDICKITGLTPARCSRSVPCNDTGVKTLAEPEPFARFLRQR